jgi:peptidoglycan/xylan/chitin deacetylase (PgdA/CDA1 family)
VSGHQFGWLLVASAVAYAAPALAQPNEAKPKQTALVKAAKPKEPKPDLSTLTDDPLVGKADRIDGTEAKGMVTFTFDDGPNPETTPAVLEALAKYNIPATFFIVSRRLVGKYGEKSRELLARQIAAGYLIASHSFSHPNLRGASTKLLSKEIDEAVRILAKEAGKPVGIFRAPFGAIDNTGRGWLKKRGLTEARWSIDTLDWQAKDAEKLRKKVFNMIVKQDGGVVLMHDVKPITAKIIANVLDDLEAENCRRLADKPAAGAKQLEPILPVSIHYFLRDKKQPRAVPDSVKKTTEAYRTALPGRCAKRPPPPPPEPPRLVKPKTEPAGAPAAATKPAKP